MAKLLDEVLVQGALEGDGEGRKHEGLEILVPWSYVVAILEVGAEGGGAGRIGFL